MTMLLRMTQGLEIEALDNQPGVLSHRFLGGRYTI